MSNENGMLVEVRQGGKVVKLKYTCGYCHLVQQYLGQLKCIYCDALLPPVLRRVQ